MTTARMLASAWHWKLEVVAGSAAMITLYAIWVRPLGWRAVSWISAVLILALSLVSPLDTLAHDYLFSAHMAQHLLMTLVVPPLLLAGVPPRLLTRAMSWGPVRWLGNPLMAWAVANGVLWAWHAPPLYGAALESDGIHILQHAAFLSTATLFWWPVFAPSSSRSQLQPWSVAAYLFAAMAASSVLGILLAFAPTGLYPHYLTPSDHHGLLGLVRESWGISPADDQQLGGMLMWIPGGLLYGFAIIAALVRWFEDADQEESVSTNTCSATQWVLSASGAIREVVLREEAGHGMEGKRYDG